MIFKCRFINIRFIKFSSFSALSQRLFYYIYIICLKVEHFIATCILCSQLSKLITIKKKFSSENTNSSQTTATSAKSLYSNTNTFYKLGIDDSNHASYMFNFFLHGASRVCTSVDMKLHKPIRVLNQFDLLKLKTNIKRKLRISRSRSNRYKPSTECASSSSSSSSLPFRGLKCILGPYGIAARLLGYLADESTEARLTVSEWQQFYPLKLVPHLPYVFVVGIGEGNHTKLFYPNCFIYIVMDSEWDLSDDELNYDICRDEADTTSDSSINTINTIER